MHSPHDVMMFVTKEGRNHFADWYLFELDSELQSPVREAITRQLITRGKGLIDTLWLKPVYQDLFQLRIRKSRKPQRIRILLRIYLCFDGNDEIVLLSGYNKGVDTSRETQSIEIDRARKLLNEWRQGNGRTESAGYLLS